MKKVEIKVRDRDKEIQHTYEIPADAVEFQALVRGAAKEPLEKFYGLYLYARDLKERASVRESIAPETTVVKRDGKEIDLFTGEISVDGKVVKTLTFTERCAVINAAFAQSTMLGAEPQKAFAVTRRKILEAKTATEQGGLLVAPK